MTGAVCGARHPVVGVVCVLLAGHDGDHAESMLNDAGTWPRAPEAPGGQPEAAWREAERGANEGAPDLRIVPPGSETTAALVDGIDGTDGIALSPPALNALFRRHEEVFNNDGDATVESVLAACALEAFVLGGAEGHDQGRKRERELLLRLIDDHRASWRRRQGRKALKRLRRDLERRG